MAQAASHIKRAFVVALLGAESTGKSALSLALAKAFWSQGIRAWVVPEYLREWCDRQGRVPRPEEQATIASTQTERIGQAKAQALALAQAIRQETRQAVVIADTTALMTAVYSDVLLGDETLYPSALAAQSSYDLTLLMGLDVPWASDGFQRDGPHARPLVDVRLRAALTRAGIAFQTVYGLGEARLSAAKTIINQALPGSPAQAWATQQQKRPR